MKIAYPHLPTMLILTIMMFFFSSCEKDNDLFLEAILEEEEQVEEPNDPNENIPPEEDTSNNDNTDEAAKATPGWFPEEPEATRPDGGVSYTPTSSSDITNPSNAGKTAIISNSFDCSGCTFAENQLIVPSGGSISGTNINLNGSYIDEILEQAFASSATFSEVYDDSWLSPEVFGGFADDSADDHVAIETLMNNAVFVRSKPNGAYIKNASNPVNRIGNFVWNLNNGSVEITSTANYNDAQTQRDYLFWTSNVNLKLFNGELDGNNIYGRGIWMIGPQAYHFENLRIHSFYANVNYRAVAVTAHIFTKAPYTKAYGAIGSVRVERPFENGFMNNCVIENITAEGDCEFNNVPSGVAKGFWFEYEQIDPAVEAAIYHSNNVIQNINGEDAEGLYLDDKTFGGGNRVNEHGIQATFYRETIRECNRRAAKITVSNVTFDECTFELSTSAKANKALGSLVDVFVFNNTANPEDYNTNIDFLNCNFNQPDILPDNDNISGCGGFIPDIPLLSIGDTFNATVKDNTFNRPDLDNYAGIRLGSVASPGKLRTSLFSGNTFINCGYEFVNYVLNQGSSPNIIENETFDYDITGTGGASQAVFRFIGFSGRVENFAISNIDIDVNWSSNILGFYGLIHSNGAEMIDFDWSDVNLTYSNASGTRFARVQGNMGDSNTFTNCLITNALGTNSLLIEGEAQNPNLIDCFDDAGNRITVQ